MMVTLPHYERDVLPACLLRARSPLFYLEFTYLEGLVGCTIPGLRLLMAFTQISIATGYRFSV